MKYVLVFVCLNIGTKWSKPTSLKFTYIPYVFETFLQVAELITS